MDTTNKPTPKIRMSSVAFLVGILLFLLPFVNIKCNEQKFASNTGIGLAFGTNYKTTSQLKSEENNRERDVSITDRQSGKMYVAALISLLLGITGFILTIIRPGAGKLNSMIAVLAALAMIILLMHIKYDVRDKSSREITEGFRASLKVTVEFTAWYYLSLLSFLAASFLSYRKNLS